VGWDFETKFAAVLLLVIVVAFALTFASDWLWPVPP
jgi:uncharacterized membrane protein YphA (DoxX/SURF4 family)